MSLKPKEARSGSSGESAIDNRVKKHSSRRGFIAKTLISAVAITTTAKLAKKTASLMEPDHQKEYLKDIAAGDRALRQTRYEVMSRAEKRDLVRTLVESYRKNSV